MPHAEYRPSPADAEQLLGLRPRLDSDLLMVPAQGIIEAHRQTLSTEGVEGKEAAE